MTFSREGGSKNRSFLGFKLEILTHVKYVLLRTELYCFVALINIKKRSL